MNNRMLRRAQALLLVSVGFATPLLADVGVPPPGNVDAKLGTCVAHVIRFSEPSNMNLDNLKKSIVSQCQSETIEWNE